MVLNEQDLLRVPCCSPEQITNPNQNSCRLVCRAGHAQPSVRLGDLVRQHDRLSSKDASPAAGQVPWLHINRVLSSCRGFLRLAGLPVMSGFAQPVSEIFAAAVP